MDRANVSDYEFSDENRTPNGVIPNRKKWKKRRGFDRKSRKAARPTTYMGQRSNSHPRSAQL